MWFLINISSGRNITVIIYPGLYTGIDVSWQQNVGSILNRFREPISKRGSEGKRHSSLLPPVLERQTFPKAFHFYPDRTTTKLFHQTYQRHVSVYLFLDSEPLLAQSKWSNDQDMKVKASRELLKAIPLLSPKTWESKRYQHWVFLYPNNSV